MDYALALELAHFMYPRARFVKLWEISLARTRKELAEIQVADWHSEMLWLIESKYPKFITLTADGIVKVFSDEEIKELLNVYKTLPWLAGKLMALNDELVEANMDLLDEITKEAAKNLDETRQTEYYDKDYEEDEDEDDEDEDDEDEDKW